MVPKESVVRRVPLFTKSDIATWSDPAIGGGGYDIVNLCGDDGVPILHYGLKGMVFGETSFLNWWSQVRPPLASQLR